MVDTFFCIFGCSGDYKWFKFHEVSDEMEPSILSTPKGDPTWLSLKVKLI